MPLQQQEKCPRTILAASFGIAMQYLLDTSREELLGGFTILESVIP
jgi:hypothetical protein